MVAVSTFREFGEKNIILMGGDPIKIIPVEYEDSFSRQKNIILNDEETTN